MTDYAAFLARKQRTWTGEQLCLDFSVRIFVPLYRMTWRDGAIVHVVEVPAHMVMVET